MRKDEFFKQLEYLLQDIPDGDKEEALSYYRDYLEEAGSENEEKVMAEFGSPERVAAIIRADLSGNLEDGGSFTESGYEDERFRDPNFQVARRLDLPDEREGREEETKGYGRAGDGRGDGTYEKSPFRDKYTRSKVSSPGAAPKEKPWTNKVLKFVLWVILIIAASPFLLGAAGIALGGVTGIVSLVLGAVAVAFCLTAAAFIASVALGVFGVVLFSVTTPLDSLFTIGIAALGLGLGLVGVGVLTWIFWKLIPLLIKGIRKLWNMIFRRGRKEETAE